MPSTTAWATSHAVDYGWDRATTTGLAITFTDSGQVVHQHPQAALAIADTLVGMCHYGLLFGHRIISLLQGDSPDVQSGPVGGRTVPWNSRQWLRSRRLDPGSQEP
jgi:hypothetical protein